MSSPPAITVAQLLALLLVAASCGEPYSFVLDPGDYDRSCVADADCMLIFDGDLCECLRCKEAAINEAEAGRYAQTFRSVTAECSTIDCGQSEDKDSQAGRVVSCTTEAFCDDGTCAVREGPGA